MSKENAAHIAFIEKQNKHRNETISDDKTRKHKNPLSLHNILDLKISVSDLLVVYIKFEKSVKMPT